MHIYFRYDLYRTKNRSGTGSKTVFQTDRTRYGRARTAIRKTINKIQHHPIKEQVRILSAILRGHFNYYGIAGNAQKINKFWHQVKNEWRYSLTRRSQKGRITWENLKEILQENPLPSPRIRLSYADLGAYVRL